MKGEANSARSIFPPVEYANADGLLAYGGSLTIDTLWDAYSHGIFPWPHDDLPLLWFAPEERAVLFIDELHLGRRLRRAFRAAGFEARRDTCFEAVVAACAAPREGEQGTWINTEVAETYSALHNLRDPLFGAHSFEAWRDDKLVGGLYGIRIGNYFCGESMFHTEPNASKFALCALIDYLAEQGAAWLDIQMMTPHFAALGARLVPREGFMKLLGRSLEGATLSVNGLSGARPRFHLPVLPPSSPARAPKR